MLRVYFVQQRFNLSDPQAEDALYDMESVRRFVGVELSEDRLPDETTISASATCCARHRASRGGDRCSDGGSQSTARPAAWRGTDALRGPGVLE
jgi:hypothetical protein